MRERSEELFGKFVLSATRIVMSLSNQNLRPHNRVPSVPRGLTIFEEKMIFHD